MVEISTYFVYVTLLLSLIVILKTKTIATIHTNDFLISRNRFLIQDYFCLALITIIVSFRYDVGVDWDSYRDYFDNLNLFKSITFREQQMEFGYYFINRVVSNLGGNYVMAFIVVTFITWLFIFKSAPGYLLPLVIFFIFADEYFFWSMNGVRQFTAIAIFVYSIRYIIVKNFKRFLLFVIIGALFHNSILLLIPLYFVPFSKLYNQKIWMIILIISILISQTSFILVGISTLISALAGYIPIFEKYLGYLEFSDFKSSSENSVGLGFFFRAIISFLLIFLSHIVIRKFPSSKVYFVLFFIGMVLFNMFYSFTIIGRFVHYFLIFRAYVLAVSVYVLYTNKRYQFIAIGIVILYFLLFLSTIYNSSNQCCPYQLIN